MRNPDLNRCPPDLVETFELLERERPVATPLELDQMKTRIMARRQSMRRSGSKGSLLKTRFAITMMLVLGILMSCTGAGLAVSGSSGSGSAGAAQYGNNNNNNGGNNNGNVLGSEEQPAAQTQEANQVAATTSSGSLPFTGLAAIPILAVGVGLFGTGLVVRRSARRAEQA
jgi:hypothetical protein